MIRFFRHLRSYGHEYKSLSLISLMILFWSLFDAMLAFAIPVQLARQGFSKTTIGIIIGSSSLAGAAFDFLLSHFLKNTHFRRLYLLLFISCFAAGYFLWKANNIWLFFVVMALWGLYYDLVNFGNFNFVAMQQKEDQHATSFGILDIFKAIGYLLGPLIAGLAIGELIEPMYFVLMFTFLGFGFLVYIVVSFVYQKKESVVRRKQSLSVVLELKHWRRLGAKLLPVLVFVMLLNIYDAFFWTIGPLVSEELSTSHALGGLFLSVYSFPILLVGWFTGRIANRFGKKRTAFMAFGVGSLLLSLLGFLSSPVFIISLVFLVSFLATIAWPAIHGAFADYMSEDSPAATEIEGLADFFTNLGYIIGPVLAGICADLLGLLPSFTALGLFGFAVSMLLFFTTPKKITVS